MEPGAAAAIAAFLIQDFQQELQTTVRVLEAATGTRLEYQPDPKSKSGLGLVRHIVLEDEWMLSSILAGRFDPPPDDSDACGIPTPAEAVVRYRRTIPEGLDKVRAMSGEQWVQPINMFGQFEAPALVFLSMAIKHSVHHRGQLSAYLRAMGGKVPGIYGPSADAQ